MKNPLYDDYLRRNPDVAASGMSALDHYGIFGAAEGRTWGAGQGQAAPMSSLEMDYLQRNPDVAASVNAGGFTNGRDHYIQHGASEGREYTPGIYTNTDAGWDAYRAGAQQQTAGLNRMPGIFSDYAGMSANPDEARNQMSIRDRGQLDTQMNPLFAELLGSVIGSTTPADAQAQTAAQVTPEAASPEGTNDAAQFRWINNDGDYVEIGPDGAYRTVQRSDDAKIKRAVLGR